MFGRIYINGSNQDLKLAPQINGSNQDLKLAAQIMAQIRISNCQLRSWLKSITLQVVYGISISLE